ncbi:MAG: hypothetical protein IT243_10405 [Bacteroidia bacterium]|nr:hypothetical protein [Bacteroidia bacterium]
MKKAVLLLILTKIIIFISLSIAKADSEITDNSILLKGSQISKNNHIVWKIESEHDIDFYTIEFSNDNFNFKKIADITGKESNGNATLYSFMHKNVESGNAYYRVVRYSKTGEISYSETIVIYNNSELLNN